MGAKSRYLNDFVSEMHMRQTKAPTNEAAIMKQLPDIFGTRVSYDVEVLGFSSQQQIAHTTTDQKGPVTGALQPVQHFQGMVTDIGAREGMRGTRCNYGIANSLPSLLMMVVTMT